MPKKVSIVLPFFADGGMERAMMNLASGLLSRNVQVDLVLLKRGYGTLASEIPKGANVIDLGAKSFLQAFFKFRTYMRNSGGDYVLSLATPANLTAIFSRFFSRSRYRLLVSTQVTLAGDGHSSLIKKITRQFIYRLYNLADFVHAPSQGVADDLVRFGVTRSKIRIIYNPIISPEILKMSEETAPHEWFQQDAIPVILGVGRLVSQKDFPTLLRAFALVRKQQKMRLAILGEGPDQVALVQLAKELGIESDFVLLGFSNNPYAYLKRASLFVLSSAWEGFGNVLAEAIALGTPAVSTDCPHGPREILEDEKYGKLVPVGDSIKLSEAILATLANPARKEFLKSGAERFTIEHVTEEYLKVFTENIHGK